MQVEITILLSFVSLCVAGVVAVTSIRRNKAMDDKKEASDMTTLIVKLENIGNGINEIKSDMRNIKEDMQNLRDRLIIVEQSTQSAHKRVDELVMQKEE